MRPALIFVFALAALTSCPSFDNVETYCQVDRDCGSGQQCDKHQCSDCCSAVICPNLPKCRVAVDACKVTSSGATVKLCATGGCTCTDLETCDSPGKYNLPDQGTGAKICCKLVCPSANATCCLQ